MDVAMLREAVLDFADEKLLDIRRNRRDEYNPEALKVFEDEIARRGIDSDAAVGAADRTEIAAAAAEAAVLHLSRDDFVPLDCPFTKADSLIANAILRDSKVPYVIERYIDPAAAADASVGALGGENSAIASAVLFGEHLVVDVAGSMELYAVLVYKDALSAAQELINEHFEPGHNGSRYVPRQSGVADRIRAFSLYDVKMSEAAAYELLEVDLSKQGRAAIVKLAGALQNEADAIEEETGRVVFFYDTMEPLAEKLKSGSSSLTRTEFLAIIELCQIYCEDERYDPALNEVAVSILDFFLG